MNFKDRAEYKETEGSFKLHLWKKFKLNCFIRKVKHFKLGYTKWQLMQEKVSTFPDWGFYARKRAAFYMSTMDCGDKFYAHTGVIFLYPQNISIGNNVSINRNSIITAKTKIRIGNNVSIGPNVIINSGNHNFDDVYIPINKQGHKLAPITIEDDVWIGAGAIILSGITVGKGSVIAAGAVVNKDVLPYSVVGGVPIKLLKMRK